MIVFVACGLAACTTQEAKPDGSGAAGTSGNAGSNGGAGTTGTGGAGGLATNDGVFCLPPAQAISDFTYDADAGSMQGPRFGVFGTSWSGGGSTYPAGLTEDLTGNDWHIMGMITDYSGFNLYSDNVNAAMCNKVNAADFAGIQFTIWGTVPSPNQITMGIPILTDAAPGSWLKFVNAVNVTGNEPGHCFPGTGMTQYYHPDCSDPIYSFAVTGTQAAPQTVSVMWNMFAGGKPRTDVLPSEILGIYWYVTWGGATSTPYSVDIHIDNLAFIPK
jgi:hypothetical protein